MDPGVMARRLHRINTAVEAAAETVVARPAREQQPD
jgi:hypothetical protein